MVISKKMSYFGGLLFLANTAISNAALVNNGDGTVTDTDAGLMWLIDLNFTDSTGYDDALYGTDTNGALTWDDAMFWADNLAFAGYDDWRLPGATVKCVANPLYDPATPYLYPECIDVVGGELADLYYNTLGNTQYDSTPNLGPFINTPYWPQYWTSLEYDAANAYDFHLLEWDYSTYPGTEIGGGFGHAYDKNAPTNVIAVRSISSVPEPAALSLVAMGLAGVFMSRNRRNTSC